MRLAAKAIRFGVAPITVALALVLASPASATFSITAFTATTTSSLAGTHPDLSVHLGFPTIALEPPLEFADGQVRDALVDLPPGLVGDPTATPQCAQADFASFACPPGAQVGTAVVKLLSEGGFPINPPPVPLYNMEPRNAEETAELAFSAGGFITVHMPVAVRTDGDYGLTVGAEGISRAQRVAQVTVTVWGVPGAPGHDSERTNMLFTPVPPPGIGQSPFFTNATRCDAPLALMARVDSYEAPGTFQTASATLPRLEGCDSVPFAPEFTLRSDSRRAGAPAGFQATLTIPQSTGADSQATADLRDVAVSLPPGVTLSTSAADGLKACSDLALRLGRREAAACPDGARIGDVELDTPVLPKPVHGGVYLRPPLPGDLFRIALVADDFGVHLKIPGDVRPSPQTGQLTATFKDAPQLPFETLTMDLNGGARAPLVNPSACGRYTTRALLTPWSSLVPRESLSSFVIDQGCQATATLSPTLEAGSKSPLAGQFSPFVVRVVSPDGQQNLSQLEVTLPQGLLAKLAGVPICGDPEAAAGACPVSSSVGSVAVGVGAGALPLFLPQHGKAPAAVFLAGPYRGAPYSLVVEVPAQAGPFDLGTVAVRSALYVDPTTTAVSVKSDPLPQILEGVPIRYRDLRVTVDRPDFTLNPTNCDAMSVSSRLSGIGGATGNASSPFSVTECEHLAFKPSLTLSLRGQTGRSGNPALSAVLRAPKGQANIAKAAVLLPASEFIDNAHINSPCTRVQFNADACPKGSILGTATAYTPLLDKPLTGPVYFRSNGGERELPDLVADLDGAIHVTLVGFIDAVPIKGTERSRVRTRFSSVPDAPVSKFVLKLKGGAKGLIENSVNLCQKPRGAKVQLQGQNGKSYNYETPLAAKCGEAKRSKG